MPCVYLPTVSRRRLLMDFFLIYNALAEKAPDSDSEPGKEVDGTGSRRVTGLGEDDFGRRRGAS